MIIEKIVLDYLTETLSAPVVIETPTADLTEYVIFRLYDSGKENHINSATIEFECYSDSKYNAATLDEKLREAMENIVVLNEISASKFGGGSDENDSELNRYRYRSFFNLFY